MDSSAIRQEVKHAKKGKNRTNARTHNFNINSVEMYSSPPDNVSTLSPIRKEGPGAADQSTVCSHDGLGVVKNKSYNHGTQKKAALPSEQEQQNQTKTLTAAALEQLARSHHTHKKRNINLEDHRLRRVQQHEEGDAGAKGGAADGTGNGSGKADNNRFSDHSSASSSLSSSTSSSSSSSSSVFLRGRRLSADSDVGGTVGNASTVRRGGGGIGGGEEAAVSIKESRAALIANKNNNSAGGGEGGGAVGKKKNKTKSNHHKLTNTTHNVNQSSHPLLTPRKHTSVSRPTAAAALIAAEYRQRHRLPVLLQQPSGTSNSSLHHSAASSSPQSAIQIDDEDHEEEGRQHDRSRSPRSLSSSPSRLPLPPPSVLPRQEKVYHALGLPYTDFIRQAYTAVEEEENEKVENESNEGEEQSRCDGKKFEKSDVDVEDADADGGGKVPNATTNVSNAATRKRDASTADEEEQSQRLLLIARAFASAATVAPQGSLQERNEVLLKKMFRDAGDALKFELVGQLGGEARKGTFKSMAGEGDETQTNHHNGATRGDTDASDEGDHPNNHTSHNKRSPIANKTIITSRIARKLMSDPIMHTAFSEAYKQQKMAAGKGRGEGGSEDDGGEGASSAKVTSATMTPRKATKQITNNNNDRIKTKSKSPSAIKPWYDESHSVYCSTLPPLAASVALSGVHSSTYFPNGAGRQQQQRSQNASGANDESGSSPANARTVAVDAFDGGHHGEANEPSPRTKQAPSESWEKARVHANDKKVVGSASTETDGKPPPPAEAFSSSHSRSHHREAPTPSTPPPRHPSLIVFDVQELVEAEQRRILREYMTLATELQNGTGVGASGNTATTTLSSMPAADRPAHTKLPHLLSSFFHLHLDFTKIRRQPPPSLVPRQKINENKQEDDREEKEEEEEETSLSSSPPPPPPITPVELIYIVHYLTTLQKSQGSLVHVAGLVGPIDADIDVNTKKSKKMPNEKKKKMKTKQQSASSSVSFPFAGSCHTFDDCGGEDIVSVLQSINCIGSINLSNLTVVSPSSSSSANGLHSPSEANATNPPPAAADSAAAAPQPQTQTPMTVQELNDRKQLLQAHQRAAEAVGTDLLIKKLLAVCSPTLTELTLPKGKGTTVVRASDRPASAPSSSLLMPFNASLLNPFPISDALVSRINTLLEDNMKEQRRIDRRGGGGGGLGVEILKSVSALPPPSPSSPQRPQQPSLQSSSPTSLPPITTANHHQQHAALPDSDAFSQKASPPQSQLQATTDQRRRGAGASPTPLSLIYNQSNNDKHNNSLNNKSANIIESGGGGNGSTASSFSHRSTSSVKQHGSHPSFRHTRTTTTTTTPKRRRSNQSLHPLAIGGSLQRTIRGGAASSAVGNGNVTSANDSGDKPVRGNNGSATSSATDIDFYIWENRHRLALIELERRAMIELFKRENRQRIIITIEVQGAFTAKRHLEERRAFEKIAFEEMLKPKVFEKERRQFKNILIEMLVDAEVVQRNSILRSLRRMLEQLRRDNREALVAIRTRQKAREDAERLEQNYLAAQQAARMQSQASYGQFPK